MKNIIFFFSLFCFNTSLWAQDPDLPDGFDYILETTSLGSGSYGRYIYYVTVIKQADRTDLTPSFAIVLSDPYLEKGTFLAAKNLESKYVKIVSERELFKHSEDVAIFFVDRLDITARERESMRSLAASFPGHISMRKISVYIGDFNIIEIE